MDQTNSHASDDESKIRRCRCLVPFNMMPLYEGVEGVCSVM